MSIARIGTTTAHRFSKPGLTLAQYLRSLSRLHQLENCLCTTAQHDLLLNSMEIKRIARHNRILLFMREYPGNEHSSIGI